MPVKDPPYTIHDDYSSYMWIASRDVTSGQDLGGLYVGEDATPFTEYVLFLTFLVGPSGPVIQEATARVRSNVSVDAGSILKATRLLAVEADVTEDFLQATTLDQTQLKAFREAMSPGDIALVYYPTGVQNQERLSAYAGETILGRMALTYPERIMGLVTDLSNSAATSWTLTEALTYVFGRWAADHAWFRYETVPDLRMARPDGDYSDGAGRPSTSVIGIPQSTTNRKSMREIVDEFLSAVPGTVLTTSATGELRIVPRDGPDADATAFKTLDGDDAYQVSTGFPDSRASVNGAIVTNRGWTLEESVSVMQPAWFMTRQAGTPADRYLTPPSNVLDLTTSTLLGATAAPGVWPLALEDTVLDTDAVLTWTDPDTSNLLLTGHIRYYLYPSGAVDNTDDTTSEAEFDFEDVTDLTLDGAWHEVFTLRRTFASGANPGFHVTYEARFNEEQGGVEFRVADAKLSGGFWDGATYWASGQAVFGVTLDALGNRWGNSVTRTASFTQADGATLVGDDGGNAIADSVAAYGERVDSIHISVFDIPTDTLQLIAQAHVLRNINPTTIRSVEQSAWRAFPIKFEDVGRLIELPSGETGYVLNRRYSDDFGIDYSDGSLSCTVDVEVVTASDDLLGDTSGFLFADDGGLFVMDDGNPSEVN